MGELSFKAIGIDRLRMASDGEGVTTLVAGAGCPLRCRYCLNPQCFERSDIIRSYPIQKLIDILKVDDLYFQATGGGVVFGGGEPLLQAGFIHEFKRSCPEQWKISLESSLAVPEEALLQVIDDIDFFLIDIKDMNSEIYQKYTGLDNRRVLANLKILAKRGLAEKTRIRVPLIPDYNTEEDRSESVRLLKEMGFSDFDLFRYDTELALSKRS